MSHGPQGEGWGIMWDNCWIALASANQKGGKEEEGEDRRIQCGGRGGVQWPEEVSVPRRWGKSSGGNYYERRQVKLD
ncbi:hypothetical protein CgunFtcFv8_011660 [Champsocephalus gunnari]|uniref:Uncharacterized protein n=1 Tax=Champsocephalus gunnari TaxID=52237 RepID=A0AAN8HLU6_CHAGU|nr:hypothetical protein CgunFtcFv8_011660 [Champsocephalus gunnari]